jgi:hypothetical protein
MANKTISQIQIGSEVYQIAPSGSTTPSAHASTTSEFGLGDASNFGHVKLTSNFVSKLPTGKTSWDQLSADSGYATTPYALHRMYNYMETGKDTGIEDTSTAGLAKPKAHAVSSTIYGAGTKNNFGHVKLTDSLSNASTASNGIAVTPTAVRESYKIYLSDSKSLASQKTATDEKVKFTMPKDSSIIFKKSYSGINIITVNLGGLQLLLNENKSEGTDIALDIGKYIAGDSTLGNYKPTVNTYAECCLSNHHGIIKDARLTHSTNGDLKIHFHLEGKKMTKAITTNLFCTIVDF